MNLRIASAFAALAAGVGSLSAQGLPPAAPPVTTPPAIQSPYLGSAMPAPGAAGALPQAPALPPEVMFGAPEAGNQFFIGADYLLWKIRGQPLPRNFSAVPIGLIEVQPRAIGDGLNQPISATPVYVPLSILSESTFGGPQSSDPGFANGARINFGVWADASHTWGLESSTFILDRVGDTRSVVNAGNANPLVLGTGVNNIFFITSGLGEPVQTPTEITLPRQGTASITLSTSTSLYGTELNARSINYQFGNTRIGTLIGARYINFTDKLDSTSFTRLALPTGVTDVVGTNISRDLSFTTMDSITVRNNFVGAQIGFDAESQVGALTFYGRIKFAAGPNFQSSSASGSTVVSNNDPLRSAPASVAYQGGQLTGVADSGPGDRTRYSFIPELNLKLGYQVAPWARLTVGYDGLYLGHMARAGLSTLNNTINTTVTSGGNPNTSNFVQPAFRLADHDAWVQGMSLGFEIFF
jgi:hypothetical protein